MIASALAGACPRCNAATLFRGLIDFAPACRACGLDFSVYNVGDGPAAFLTLIIGALVVIGALSLQFSLMPPWWVHVLIWPGVSFTLVILGLRIGKAALLRSEYRK